MKNTRKVFDELEVIDPELVLKIGLVFDDYKASMRDEMWAKCHVEAGKQIPGFTADDHFFTETFDGPMPKTKTETRYYTPASNRRPVSPRGH